MIRQNDQKELDISILLCVLARSGRKEELKLIICAMNGHVLLHMVNLFILENSIQSYKTQGKVESHKTGSNMKLDDIMTVLLDGKIYTWIE